MVEGDGPGRGPQPFEVGLEAEGMVMVEADAFEDSIAVEESMVRHRQTGLVEGPDLAVQPADSGVVHERLLKVNKDDP